MTSNDNIAAGYAGSTPTRSHDERVAAGYQPNAMTEALEALEQRDANALTPQMRIALGYHQGAREAAKRVNGGDAQ